MEINALKIDLSLENKKPSLMRWLNNGFLILN
jgi:hypothetical protein